MNIREAIERSWRRDEKPSWASFWRCLCHVPQCFKSFADGSPYCSYHTRRWQFRRNIVRFVPRFLKAIISQKQGEKQQITEYNWENKVYEVGAWMR